MNDSEILTLKPVFKGSSSGPEEPQVQVIIDSLSLIPHIEGGYFVLTDSSDMSIPSPYPPEPLSPETIAEAGNRPGYDPAERLLSSTIFYYLTPQRPLGSFHRNRSRIIHSLQKGRGCYVLIHPDGRVESFVVGHDVSKWEKMQWVVEGGVWKASFLLKNDDEYGAENVNEGLLISETVVPGFEYADHEFLTRRHAREMLPEQTVADLAWLIRDGGQNLEE